MIIQPFGLSLVRHRRILLEISGGNLSSNEVTYNTDSLKTLTDSFRRSFTDDLIMMPLVVVEGVFLF